MIRCADGIDGGGRRVRRSALIAVVLLAALFGCGGGGDGSSSSWKLVWRDEFNGRAGTGVDRDKWLYDLGTGYPGGTAQLGHR